MFLSLGRDALTTTALLLLTTIKPTYYLRCASERSTAEQSTQSPPHLSFSRLEHRGRICAWGTWRIAGKSPLCSCRSSAISCFQYLGTARICGLCRCFPTFLGGSENVMKATGLLWWCIPIIPGLENRRTCAFVEASRWSVRLHGWHGSE